MYLSASSAAARSALAEYSHVVVLLEAGLQALEDLDRLLHRRLDDVDLLEAPRQRTVLFEDAAVLLVGRRADAAQIARGKHRLDQVGRVHDATGGRSGPDDRVDLVDEQDRLRLALEVGQHRLEALLEIAAVLGAGHQPAQVERINRATGQHIRHLAIDDLLRQSLGDGGLADTGLTDEKRIVLATPAQNLDGALDFAHADRSADRSCPCRACSLRLLA